MLDVSDCLHNESPKWTAQPMRESTVEQHLKDRAEALGLLVRKVKFLGVDGAPDRVLMSPDRMVNGIAARTTFWVELKRPGGEARTRQLREHEAMRKHGQLVVVLDTVEAVDAFLEQFE
jgi:hypothetical protein